LSYQYYILKNGIKIIHRVHKGNVSHCGLMVNTGSRDEAENEGGMAHFIEHMIFKGTKKRKAYHVLSRIENIGGDLNAFTTKEETCIYASFLSPYYGQTLDLFADVAFNSVFPPKEIKKEIDVVIDEINAYNDTPEEMIYDDFEDMIFKGHPLAGNILGNSENVSRFKRNDILRFIKKNYSTRQMVIASVGHISFDRLIKLVEKYFGELPESDRNDNRVPFHTYAPVHLEVKKTSFLTHAIIGNVAYSRNHPFYLPMVVLNNLLGGPTLNSRLNLAVREKYGYAYSVDSMYQPYSDTGVFAVYLGSDKNHIQKSMELVQKELKKLCEKKLGTIQLKRAKQQVIGQLAISYESRLAEMLSLAKKIVHNTPVKSIEQTVNDIEGISAKDILHVANEIFNPDQLSSLVYKSK